MKVFISYASKDGLDYAQTARRLFPEAGHRAWLWEHDKTLGGRTWDEISKCIVNSDAFFYICTHASKQSWGQAEEVEYALNNRVKIQVVSLDQAEVPTVLSARNYEYWKSKEFAKQCEKLAANLPDVLKRIQASDKMAVQKQVADPRAKRLQYIEELISEFLSSINNAYKLANLK